MTQPGSKGRNSAWHLPWHRIEIELLFAIAVESFLLPFFFAIMVARSPGDHRPLDRFFLSFFFLSVSSSFFFLLAFHFNRSQRIETFASFFFF